MEAPGVQASLLVLPLLLAAAAAELNPFFPLPDLGVPILNGFPFGGQTGEPVGAGNEAPAAGAGADSRAPRGSRDFPTDYMGQWELFKEASGISAMHMTITHKNKAIMFDATNWDSKLELPVRPCRFDPRRKMTDCLAHALEFDIETGNIRPLQVVTNPWCASGGLAADGTLVQTGGWWEGGAVIRYLDTCDSCDWKEHEDLARKRWYATQQILPDGGFIVIGGRREHNFEYVPPPGQRNTMRNVFNLPMLTETTHPKLENNLYPFVHLSTDGNLFVFANNRSLLLDPKTNKVVREFPVLKGGARSYPASGMSVLLPLNLNRRTGKAIPAEVLICGGAPPEAMDRAEAGNFDPVVNTCGRLLITQPNTDWKMELMPKPRLMADMLLLPTGDVFLVNGASKGSAGWDSARDPVFEPWIYQPQKTRTQRFKVLTPTTIPRMYHSSSAVLPDGRILVAGSNPNDGYIFSGKPFPTELRVEKFSPPYLDPALASHRPQISAVAAELKYGQSFQINFNLAETVADASDLKVTMYAQPFTTHGYSMNQRLVVLKSQGLGDLGNGVQQITATAPASGVIAPPGYYLLFVVYRGLPSKGEWVHIQQ